MTTQEQWTRRIIEEAEYIIQNMATIRQTAKEFDVSKSVVHKDVTKMLRNIDKKMYDKVRKVLDYNISQRSFRGGETTRRKYKKEKNL